MSSQHLSEVEMVAKIERFGFDKPEPEFSWFRVRLSSRSRRGVAGAEVYARSMSEAVDQFRDSITGVTGPDMVVLDCDEFDPRDSTFPPTPGREAVQS